MISTSATGKSRIPYQKSNVKQIKQYKTKIRIVSKFSCPGDAPEPRHWMATAAQIKPHLAFFLSYRRR